MAKPKKKRTKRYHGEDARSVSSSEPTVHHYQAVQRSPIGEWWQGKKRLAKPLSIAGAIILFIGWLLFELFSAIF